MFSSIGMGELLLVIVVVMLVVGPEKMPKLIRSVVRHFRQLRYYVTQFSDMIEHELSLDASKDAFEKHKTTLSKMSGLHDLNDTMYTLRDKAFRDAYLEQEQEDKPQVAISQNHTEAVKQHALSEEVFVGPPPAHAIAEAQTGIETDATIHHSTQPASHDNR